eukprot:6370266-Amphidinium_carterae.1
MEITPGATPFQTAANLPMPAPLQSMNLSELTRNTDQAMSTAMSMDGSNPVGNPTPPDSSSGIGTTVVGMGPIGTQCS